MISPYECARLFNNELGTMSDTMNEFQERILSFAKAQVFYYCLTGTQLNVRYFDEYFNANGYKVDNADFSDLEVDNLTGERQRAPIRRYLVNILSSFLK